VKDLVQERSRMAGQVRKLDKAISVFRKLDGGGPSGARKSGREETSSVSGLTPERLRLPKEYAGQSGRQRGRKRHSRRWCRSKKREREISSLRVAQTFERSS
jgi:hypothetical protein